MYVSHGWVVNEWSCLVASGSSSIQVKDERSGAIYSVGAHDLTSSSALLWGGAERRILGWSLLTAICLFVW